MADYNSSLPVRTEAAGDVSVKIDQTTDGTTNKVSADLAKVAGTVTAVGIGASTAGTQRVILATDQGAIPITGGQTDDAAFTPATDKVTMIGAFADMTAPDLVDEGDGGSLRMTLRRELLVTVRDAAGNERGLNVAADGSLAATVTNATAANLNAQVVGAAATDAAVSGNPVFVAARAFAAAPTDMSADGDVVPFWALRSGALAVQPTFAGVLGTTGNGGVGTGVQRVTLASDSTGVLANVATIGTSVTPGTSAAHLGKAEDAVHASGDTGVMALAVRADSLASTAANGDYVPLLTDSLGAAWVRISNAATAPVPVYIVGATSTAEVQSYATATVTAGTTTTTQFQYTVTTAKTLLLKQILAAGSGKIRVEVQVGPTAGLATKAVLFNSTANPNVDVEFAQPIEVPDTSTGIVRIAVKNLELSSQDCYVTIIGWEQ